MRSRHPVVPPADPVDLVATWVAAARRIVVLTGAGISTDSGIPDFRGPQGVWTVNPAAERQSKLQDYLADPQVRRAAWRSRMAHPAWTAQPNRAHRALVELERRGTLHTLITQNIDELHRIAGNSAERIVEVHGTMRRVMCWSCGQRTPMHDVLERVRAGEADPHCLACAARGEVGVIKSDTVSFGQALVPEVIDAAMRAAEECDVLLVAGSSLSVFPAANVVPRAKASGARIIIVNGEPTGMDRYADAVLIGSLAELLPALIDRRAQ